MRVGMLSYPMLFQREGGLQVQVRETLAALTRTGECCGLSASLVDPCASRLDEFDVVHVFSAINGNDRIVEAAADLGVPCVLSPLVPPGWSRSSGVRARVADRVLGNVTRWNVHSSYAQMRRALQQATLVVALGEAERRAIREAFLVDAEKVRVVPNGIGACFFEAGARLFRDRTGIEGDFVLMTGAISPYKNQLGLARALAPLELPFVIIGEARERDRGYLDEVRREAGVRWLGSLRHDDPLLASAYAAASVFALPSQGEVAPLSVMEALAAGTPVVMTDTSALDLPASEGAVARVHWQDAAAQRAAVQRFIRARPARRRVRELVQGFTWDRVGNALAGCYEEACARARRGNGRAV